jgi:hypothetical protein
LTIAADVNSTFDVPLFDIYGLVNGQLTPLLLLTGLDTNANNANELDFNVSLTDNAAVIGLLNTVGVPFQASTPLGTGSSVWN